MPDDRREFDQNEAKFSTQRQLTSAIVLIFFMAGGWVFWKGTEAQQAAILQTVINLVVAGYAYWIGSSKGSADKTAVLDKMAASPIKAEEVKVTAETATVVENPTSRSNPNETQH